MAAAMISNMKEKTGKTLDQWLKLAKKAPGSKHREILNFLKKEHGMTHGYANLVAMKSLEGAAPAASGDDLVAAQYAGAKEDLRPIYETIIKAVKKFGKDVEISPKKSYVSLRRNKQFAIIQPSTKTRVDVGINLKDHDATSRLEVSGSFNAMVTHRVRVESASDVDKELIGWLKEAYSQS
jgi:hypothetical protein